jgi:hypothetical protein
VGRKFGKAQCKGLNGWMLKEEGRRKRKEGREKKAFFKF